MNAPGGGTCSSVLLMFLSPSDLSHFRRFCWYGVLRLQMQQNTIFRRESEQIDHMWNTFSNDKKYRTNSVNQSHKHVKFSALLPDGCECVWSAQCGDIARTEALHRLQGAQSISGLPPTEGGAAAAWRWWVENRFGGVLEWVLGSRSRLLHCSVWFRNQIASLSNEHC